MLINNALSKVDNMASSSDIKQAGMPVKSFDKTEAQGNFSHTLQTLPTTQQQENVSPDLPFGSMNNAVLDQGNHQTDEQFTTIIDGEETQSQWQNQTDTSLYIAPLAALPLNQEALQYPKAQQSNLTNTAEVLVNNQRIIDGVYNSPITDSNTIKSSVSPLTTTALSSDPLAQISSLTVAKTPAANRELTVSQVVQNLTTIEQTLPANTLSQVNITANRANWAPISIDPQSPQWGEKMINILQDRVSLQATQNMQEARIRLDPPDLGKLDLIVKMEGDKLSVQISANNSAVRDALSQVSERLRHDLQQQFMSVNVNISHGEQQSHRQQTTEHTLQDDNDHLVMAASSATPIDTSTANEHWLSTLA
ncbi:flagellar hook-length control protein FliK [Photobacterium leiognathi]|uniref:flagellar hook-length control protein FliK n=1 Tax=Photobacterium leiognathi TaxID=553611 RepID=UPI00298258C2|nr:flagellar hook-length control protein FliK [Photobacterium leiognathi]